MMNAKFKCLAFNKSELEEMLRALRLYHRSVENAYEYEYLFRIICKLQKKLDELNEIARDSDLKIN